MLDGDRRLWRKELREERCVRGAYYWVDGREDGFPWGVENGEKFLYPPGVIIPYTVITHVCITVIVPSPGAFSRLFEELNWRLIIIGDLVSIFV